MPRKKEPETIDPRVVATAICRASARSGRTLDELDRPVGRETLEERVENLLRERPPYGAYVVAGDPCTWAGGRALATIFMERIGGPGDCELPLDYWGDGMEVSLRASRLLPGGAFIEFVNAAVAVVLR